MRQIDRILGTYKVTPPRVLQHLRCEMNHDIYKVVSLVGDCNVAKILLSLSSLDCTSYPLAYIIRPKKSRP